MSKGWKRALAIIIKLSLLVVLYWVLFNLVLSKIDFRSVLAQMKTANPFYLAAALIALYLKFAVSAFRFDMTSAFYSVRVPYLKFLLNEYKILFLEILFPVPDTEDFFRIVFLRLQEFKIHQCLNTVITLRITGVAALLVLITLLLTRSSGLLIQASSLLTVAAVVAVLLLLTGFRIWIRLAAGYIRKPQWLAELVARIAAVRIPPGIFLSITALALLQHVFGALAVYWILLSLGSQLAYWSILLIVPVMVLSFIIPISVQGLGLPEAVLLYMLIQFQVPETIASAASMIHLAFYISVILAGGLHFLVDRDYKLSMIRLQINQGIDFITAANKS